MLPLILGAPGNESRCNAIISWLQLNHNSSNLVTPKLYTECIITTYQETSTSITNLICLQLNYSSITEQQNVHQIHIWQGKTQLSNLYSVSCT